MTFKKLLPLLFKWFFAIVVLFWVFGSDRIDFDKIQIFLSKPWYVLSLVVVAYTMMTLSHFRWSLFLRSVGVSLSPFEWLRFGMLGMFFNAFIPGVVSGDVVKTLAVFRARQEVQKALLLLVTFVDRLMGLLGLIVFGAICFLFHKALGKGGEGFLVIDSIGSVLLVVSSVFFMFLLGFPYWMKLLSRWRDRAKFSKYFQAVDFLRKMTATFFLCFGLSLLIHFLTAVLLFAVSYELFGAPPWGQLSLSTFVVGSVLGLCVMALPISPMGIGTGQIAFAELFKLIAPDQFGASVITVFQILILFVNASAGVFFLMSSKAKGYLAEGMLSK